MLKLFTALVTIVAAVALAVATWPQLFGLETAWGVAHIVSLRAVAVLVAGAGAVLLLLLALIARPVRGVALSLTAALVLFAAAGGGILMVRGVNNPGTGPGDAAGTGAVTVLSWNTLGDAPGAERIAALAVEEGADIVTLPETSEETGVRVAELMGESGRPMWAHTIAYDRVLKARSTTVLVAAALGDYTVANAGSPGANNTRVLPSVVLRPSSGTGPTIVAAHAVAPLTVQMDNWRSDLSLLAGLCSGGNVILAGDLNATVDHMGGSGLGSCHDAARDSGSAAVGTWPSSAPALLGTPIDHVFSSEHWTTASFRVVTSLDGTGSDHRPIVATLVPSR